MSMKEFLTKVKEGEPVSRRKFFTGVGWFGFYGTLAAFLGECFRFSFPQVLYEPPMSFKAGAAADFPIGDVSLKFTQAQRVWIVRNEQGIYVFEAKCTHLGCTPNWFPDEQRFKCPCHGSNFNVAGDVVGGPAPEPLFRCSVTFTPDSKLYIDKMIKENREPKRSTPPFFLPVA